MTARRLHLILLATIGLLCIGLLGGAYGANKLLTAKAEDLTVLKAKKLALDQEQVSLKKAKQDIRTYDELDKIARAVVPEDKSQAEAVREIVNIAAAHNVKLGAITFPASTLGSTATGSSSAAKKTSPASTKNTRLSQLEAVPNIPGIYRLQITIDSDPGQPVQYDKFISFLAALERNRRTAQVHSITLSPDAKKPGFLSFTLLLHGYIKP